MLSVASSSLGFASTPSCPDCPTCPGAAHHECFAMNEYYYTMDDEKWTTYEGVPRGFGMWTPPVTNNSAFEMKYSSVEGEAVRYGIEEVTPLGMCFVEAGAHIAHAEGFSGAKVEAILTASECVKTSPDFVWQHDERYPAGEYCFVGAMDGLNAMQLLGDGTKGTLNTGKTYMRAYMNTELRGYNSEVDSSEPPTPHYKVCTSLTEGGFDQPPCPEAHQMHMNGAIEQFADVDRDTLEVVNGGLAMKKIFSATAMPHQTEWPADATSDDIYTIVTEYSQLHTNLQPDEDANYVPNCSLAETDEYYSDKKCGLYGHCGSKISPKHEFSIMHNGAPAYGATDGVGFEDNVLFVAMEGSSECGTGNCGTVQVLDVDSGDWYTLPHLSMGVVEMAFTVSTGETDYTITVIEDYGVGSASSMGMPDYECGSGWNFWVGKKDKMSSHFLDRNGLGPNQGRLYRFVADSGETDMATFVDWPASGFPGYEFTDKMGRLEPIDMVLNGVYKETDTSKGWNRTSTNCANTISGATPIRMTGRSKQEWGAANPDKPNQFAIAETGLGYSSTIIDYMEENIAMGKRASTLIFLEHDFLSATMDFASRNGSPLPSSIPCKVFHVMKDQVVMGPDRTEGMSYVDSLFWATGGNVYFAEDSSAPGGYNIGGVYNIETEKTIPLVGAIGSANKKMNVVANFPYGSFHGRSSQETTGWFDASAVLTVPAGATPQQFHDALTAKEMMLDNQMKGVGNGCMHYGFYYTSQMMFIEVPEFDWATTALYSPPACDADRRRKLSKQFPKKRALRGETATCDEINDWSDGHEDWHPDANGCQSH